MAADESPYVGIGVTPLYISLDCVNFYEVPEGMDVHEFIEQLKRDDGPDK